MMQVYLIRRPSCAKTPPLPFLPIEMHYDLAGQVTQTRSPFLEKTSHLSLSIVRLTWHPLSVALLSRNLLKTHLDSYEHPIDSHPQFYVEFSVEKILDIRSHS
jgi:hypothetical protein